MIIILLIRASVNRKMLTKIVKYDILNVYSCTGIASYYTTIKN